MIADLFKALQYGQELKDPAKWKKGVIATTAIGGIVDILLRNYGVQIGIPVEAGGTITQIIEGFLLLANLYVHKASSTKV